MTKNNVERFGETPEEARQKRKRSIRRLKKLIQGAASSTTREELEEELEDLKEDEARKND